MNRFGHQEPPSATDALFARFDAARDRRLNARELRLARDAQPARAAQPTHDPARSAQATRRRTRRLLIAGGLIVAVLSVLLALLYRSRTARKT